MPVTFICNKCHKVKDAMHQSERRVAPTCIPCMQKQDRMKPSRVAARKATAERKRREQLRKNPTSDNRRVALKREPMVKVDPILGKIFPTKQEIAFAEMDHLINDFRHLLLQSLTAVGFSANKSKVVENEEPFATELSMMIQRAHRFARKQRAAYNRKLPKN